MAYRIVRIVDTKNSTPFLLKILVLPDGYHYF